MSSVVSREPLRIWRHRTDVRQRVRRHHSSLCGRRPLRLRPTSGASRPQRSDRRGVLSGQGAERRQVTDQQSVHQCEDPDCRVESVRKLRWQIEDITFALADAMAWPDDLVVLASVRAFLTLRDVLQELDASPICRCDG